MNLFSIRDLENLSGIKAHTIRMWEQRYGFLKPARSETNIRSYCCEELKTLLNIALLNKYGFKISHINKMSLPEMSEKILSLVPPEAHQERLINDLLHHMIDLDMDGFECILDRYICSFGIDAALNNLLFPFLHRIGILWVTGHINPAQEHLVANTIRQKLIVGIEKADSRHVSKKSVLLFLPEGEYHELGLLYLQYLLKCRGAKTIYLGANTPVKDLEFVAHACHPDFLYTHITCIPGRFHFGKFLTQVQHLLPDFPLIISGQTAQHYHGQKPHPGIFLKKSLHEVHEFVDRF